MLTVVIGTLNCERLLVRTLASLVAGAAAGSVREVIVADGGSKDATEEVADIAGCEFIRVCAPLAQRLRAGAAKARSPWLMFLMPGVVLDATWTDEAAQFVRFAETHGKNDGRAAVFRKVQQAGGDRPMIVEALALLRVALGGRMRPEQGLIIGKPLYERLGGHRDQAANPEADLLRRIGRRKIAVLRSGAAMTGA